MNPTTCVKQTTSCGVIFSPLELFVVKRHFQLIVLCLLNTQQTLGGQLELYRKINIDFLKFSGKALALPYLCPQALKIQNPVLEKLNKKS